MEFKLPVPNQKAIYTWNFPVPADANAVGAELEGISEETGGKVTPEVVLAKASDESSSMHPLIEWDNTKAAERFRRDQACSILRNIQIRVIQTPYATEGPKTIEIRPYINVVEQGERFYSPLAVVVKVDEQREYALRDLRLALAAWRRKSAIFAEFAAVHGAIDILLSDNE